ncbi:MAG: 30S ribosomal protein S8 [Candidatus Saccharibacteria bacterium]|nr:30S ribosomal protein S8 [Candidatus Saccharibacteria bacterium]MCY4010961.1 30S ribosomal protein S8 [Candidatus Saccharibacteria bacterium]MCY4089058.1 30S ribosomal protein S8 [Candidatus Saccharibacteria bacterium]
MYSTDPIADMLTRIRNALMKNQPRAVIPYSQIKEKIAQILVKHQFVAGLKINGQLKDKVITITLINDKLPINPINEIKRLSKPSRRYYVDCQNIPTIRNGRGIVIISTDKGLMTGRQARRSKLGGEVICSIY